ncbi:MAG: thioredoxin family protein [Chromatiales bacterium]|nr:thioredoxin family protein [Chromatiales bacterium]
MPRWLVPVCLLLACLPAAQAEETLPEFSTAYGVERDPFVDGRTALALAKASGRHVLIELGGDWCVWCHRLDGFLASKPALHQALHNAFVLLKVNVSEENDNAEFLKDFPRALGYPHMYVSDTDGNLLQSQDTAQFIIDNRYAEKPFYDFIERWGPKPASP